MNIKTNKISLLCIFIENRRGFLYFLEIYFSALNNSGIVFTIIGCLIMRRIKINNSFFRGLILTILVLSPAFDVVNNYMAYLFGSLNDFNALKITSSNLVANSIGSIFVLITVGGILWMIIFTKSYKYE
jgi:hypothetical protein